MTSSPLPIFSTSSSSSTSFEMHNKQNSLKSACFFFTRKKTKIVVFYFEGIKITFCVVLYNIFVAIIKYCNIKILHALSIAK